MENQKGVISNSVSYGWNKVISNWKLYIPLALIYLVLSNINWLFEESKVGYVPAVDTIQFLVNIILTVGIVYISLRSYENKKVEIADLFSNSEYYLKYLFGIILYALIVTLGFFLLVVPGILWGLKYQFWFYLVMDEKIGVIEAFKRSDQITKGKRLTIFAFDIVLFAILIAGTILAGVGLLFALPIAWLAIAYFYKQLKE